MPADPDVSDGSIKPGEQRMLEMLRQADVVFIHIDNGLRQFAWIKGLASVPTRVKVGYGQDGHDKMVIRHMDISMGMSDKDFKRAVKENRRVH